MLPNFIVIWKEPNRDKILRTKTPIKSKQVVKMVYDDEKDGTKLLYLFRVKTTKYGLLSV